MEVDELTTSTAPAPKKIRQLETKIAKLESAEKVRTTERRDVPRTPGSTAGKRENKYSKYCKPLCTVESQDTSSVSVNSVLGIIQNLHLDLIHDSGTIQKTK